MKNILYIIIVLILIVGGVYFFGSKKAEAPENSTELQEELGEENASTPITNETPAPGSEVDEKVVTEQGVKEFTVEGKNFAFVPNQIKVKKGDKVKIIFKNTEGFHDFKVDEYGVATKQFKSPGTEAIEFTADKAGSFEYYCSVGSHRQMGMKGALVVE